MTTGRSTIGRSLRSELKHSYARTSLISTSGGCILGAQQKWTQIRYSSAKRRKP